jgi:hypothetical protein
MVVLRWLVDFAVGDELRGRPTILDLIRTKVFTGNFKKVK